MKKLICALLSLFCLLMLLSACHTPSDVKNLLEFPKTNWNMSLQEVMQAYDITADTAGVTVLEDESGFSVDELELFGQKTTNTIFYFQSQADGKADLVKVLLNYPDDADMQLVRKELQNAYGGSMKQYTLLRQNGASYEEEIKEKTEHYAFWHSKLPISEYLNKTDMEAFQQFATSKDEELNAGGAWITYMQNAPLVTITWEDDAKLTGNLTIPADSNFSVVKNQVVFNASILHELPQLFENVK